MSKYRKNSVGLSGGAFGDEGKGKITDKYVHDFAKKYKVIVYRDNGGANAGHSIEFDDGRRIAMHLIPSGIFVKNATVILGKCMVVDPVQVVEELKAVRELEKGQVPAQVIIDEMATTCLDTHRAFEAVLKKWEEGGRGSTARGISPAYTDVLLRHPIRMRDFKPFNQEKLSKHYRLYEALIKGLGEDIKEIEVMSLLGPIKVGSLNDFLNRLKTATKILSPNIANVSDLLKKAWKDKKYAFVFEKAQGVGLDPRYGVYPDVTSSDCTFAGILSSTEGIINPNEIAVRAAVIKATYMSSVGTRKLPAMMDEKWAVKVREDAHEYGATTKRPRDIALLDLPAIRFFNKVNNTNCLVLTHMDIVYPKFPVKVCVGYKLNSKPVDYRPDQEFISKVIPIFKSLPTWSREEIVRAKTWKQVPKKAKNFVKFIEQQMGVPVKIITTGPRRSQYIKVT